MGRSVCVCVCLGGGGYLYANNHSVKLTTKMVKHQSGYCLNSFREQGHRQCLRTQLLSSQMSEAQSLFPWMDEKQTCAQWKNFHAKFCWNNSISNKDLIGSEEQPYCSWLCSGKVVHISYGIHSKMEYFFFSKFGHTCTTKHSYDNDGNSMH